MGSENGKKHNDPENMDDDDANDPIRRSIGHFGTWQLYITLALMLSRIPLAWHLLGIVFLAPKIDFNCTLAEGEAEPEWISPAIEQSLVLKWLGSMARNSLGEGNYNASYDPRCFKNGKDCVKWEYNREVFKSTIISEWDLVCKKKQLSDIAQLIFMLGVLIGNITFGMASDIWGRKKPIVISVILQLATGTGCSFVNNYILYLVLRFFVAVGTGGGMVVGYVICMEALSKKYRTMVSTIFHAPFFLGHALLPIASYFFRDWRDYQLAITLPFILLLSYAWIIPESPRWLLAVGKKQEALEILQKVAKVNKMPRPEMDIIEGAMANNKQVKKGNLTDIFKTPNMRKWSICLFCQWFNSGVCYFGLAQYMSKMGGNIFVNVAVAGSVEVFGVFMAVYGLQRFGRKLTIGVSTLLSGVFCLLILAVPSDADVYYTVVLAGIGIVGTSIVFPSIYVYSGEIFPTVVRNNGLGACSMVARMGSMIAPFVSSIEGIFAPLIFGVIPMFATAAIFFLPETRNWELPTTIEEAELYGSSKSRRKGVENKGFDST